MLSLPEEEANRIQHDGMTVLIAMAKVVSDWPWSDAEDLENMVMEFLDREDLSLEMLRSVFETSWCGMTNSVSAMFLCLREKKPDRNRSSTGAGNMRIAHRIMSILAEMSPEVLGGLTSVFFGDTMLHHILEPTGPMHSNDKSAEEAHFCLSLVAKMSLPQLCHRNREGICALSYAEDFAAQIRGRMPWVEVRDTIKHRIVLLSSEITSLANLLEQVHMIQQAERSASHEGLETAHLQELISTIRGFAWKLAELVRDEWLRWGWRFRSRALPGQIDEVIQHFRPRHAVEG